MSPQPSEKSPRAHITEIYNESANIGRYSIALANKLDDDIHTAFKGDKKYVNELVQNADDELLAGQPDHIHFHLTKDILVVQHHGRPFSPIDIEKICDYAQRAHTEKVENPNKTGYKGIGFKAVFSISDCVTIISGGYTFRFDRKYWEAKQTDPVKPYPWPMIPIWTEATELPIDVTHAAPVTMIINLKTPAAVKQDLQELISNPELLLFLRRLRGIKISIDNQPDLSIEMQEESGVKRLLVNGAIKSEWQMQSYLLNIPAHVKENLMLASDRECPPKLKNATQVTISFAYKREGDKVVKTKNATLYTYLPTRTICDFPFLVNADFVLNPERTTLIDNPWNEFLLMSLGRWHIQSLSDMARQHLARYIPTVLSPANPNHTSLPIRLNAAFKAGLQTGLAEIPFLPALANPNNLLRLSEVIIDELGFWSVFSQYIPDARYPAAKIIYPDVEEVTKLKEYAPYFNAAKQVFGEQAFIDSLKDYAKMLSHIDRNRRLAVFIKVFIERKPAYMKAELHRKLAQIPFLLSANNQIKAPQELYFSAGANNLATPSFLTISYVHSELAGDPALGSEFFSSMGVRSLCNRDLILGACLQELQNNPALSVAYSIQLLQFVFDTFLRKEITENDLQKLRGIYVVTQHGILQRTTQCYISDPYFPEQFLADPHVQNKILLLSPEYIRASDVKQHWLQFWHVLGMAGLLEIKTSKTQFCGPLQQEMGSNFSSYYRHLNLQDGVRTSSAMDNQDCLSDFVHIPLLDLLKTSPHLAEIFWKLIIHYKVPILEHMQHTSYHYARGTTKSNVTSLLQYYLQNLNCLPATDGRLYAAKHIFPPYPHLSESLGPFFPVALGGVELPEDLVKAIGFKTKLSISECIAILRKITSNTPVPTIMRTHTMVLEHLLAYETSDIRKELALSKVGICLLSTNHSLKPSSTLVYIPEGQTVIDETATLKNYPSISPRSMKRICEIFSIRETVYSQNNVETEEPEDDNEHIKAIKDRLPHIALFEIKLDGSDPEIKLRELSKKIQPLSIVKVKRLIIKDGGKNKAQSAFLNKETNTLYIKGRVTTEVVKAAFCVELKKYLGLLMSDSDIFSLLFRCKPEAPTEFAEFLDERGISVHDLEKLKALHESRPDELDNPEHAASASAGLEEGFKRLDINSDTPAPPPQTESTAASQTTHAPLPALDQINYTKISYRKVTTSPKIVRPSSPTERLTRVEGQAPTLLPDTSHLAATESQARRSSGKLTNTIDPAEAKQIGARGERVVYDKLRYHYIAKYPQCTLTETTLGFILRGTSQSGAAIELEVIWPNLNQPGHAGSQISYDFKIIKTKNGATSTRYLEVKATKASGPTDFDITAGEWGYLMAYPNHYRLLRVYAATSTTPEITKHKNLAQAIAAGQLLPCDRVTFRL